MSERLHAYEFKHCSTAGIVSATIDDIAEAGWPTCPECGEDMARISRPDEGVRLIIRDRGIESEDVGA